MRRSWGRTGFKIPRVAVALDVLAFSRLHVGSLPVNITVMTKQRLVTPKQVKTYESVLPFDDQRIGAAAVYCSDGRFGEQMDEFLHQSLGLPRYDRVAVPGGAACMAGHMMVYHEASALDRQLSFLITGHGLNKVVLIAHENCGFYKGLWIGTTKLEDQQQQDLQKAADMIRSHHPRVEVQAFFARKVEGKVRFEKWDVAEKR
jgi:hypothetical protein